MWKNEDVIDGSSGYKNIFFYLIKNIIVYLVYDRFMKLYIVDSEIEQLTSIAGINEEIANKILEFVESDEFGELNDLEKVEGVGPELLTRISTLFSDLDPETMWLEDIVPRLIMATRTRPTKWHPWPKKKSKRAGRRRSSAGGPLRAG
jgi:hypothetical protein